MDDRPTELDPDLCEAMQRIVDAFGADVELEFGRYGLEVVEVCIRTDFTRYPSDTQEAA